MTRYATLEDMGRALDMAEAKRRQYAEYQPVFHHPASIPPPPVYDPGGPVYFVSQLVAAPEAWATAGLALLIAAIELLAARGAALMVASAMPGDPEQSEALTRAGLTVVTEFFREDLAASSGGTESK